MVTILDGKVVKKEGGVRLKEKISKHSHPVTLLILQVGENEESSAYISQKKKFGEMVGANVIHLKFPENISEEEIISVVNNYNNDISVNGIILQLPIPERLNKEKILNSISPEKDVDGLSFKNTQSLKWGGKGYLPATARGILELLKFYKIQISGQKIAVLGKSALVGKPTALLMEREGGDVTVCDSKTENTKEITRSSDIVIVAIGRPGFISGEYFRDDNTQVVVDVGITSITDKGEVHLEEEIPQRRLVGDVDFEKVKDRVKSISPVPGGVGPMTVLSLFENLADTVEEGGVKV